MSHSLENTDSFGDLYIAYTFSWLVIIVRWRHAHWSAGRMATVETQNSLQMKNALKIWHPHLKFLGSFPHKLLYISSESINFLSKTGPGSAQHLFLAHSVSTFHMISTPNSIRYCYCSFPLPEMSKLWLLRPHFQKLLSAFPATGQELHTIFSLHVAPKGSRPCRHMSPKEPGS